MNKTIKLRYNADTCDYSLYTHGLLQGILRVSGLNHTLVAPLTKYLSCYQITTILRMLSDAEKNDFPVLYLTKYNIDYTVQLV